MRKIVALLSAGVLFTACSEESVSTTPQNNGMTFSNDSKGKLEIVNETFTIGKGKANAQTYILRAIASAPVVNNVPTNCTSVSVNGSFGPAGTGDIYATWHTVGVDHGGAISGYNYDLSKADETIMSFTGELRFPTVDFHDATLNPANDRIYYVGQRDVNDGFYPEEVLSSIVSTSPLSTGDHQGAVAGYITLDGAGDIVNTSVFEEKWLNGFGANGIAQHDGNAGGEFYEVVTGDNQGAVYRLGSDLKTSGSDSLLGVPDGEYVTTIQGSFLSVFQGNTAGGSPSSNLVTYNQSNFVNNRNVAAAPNHNVVNLGAMSTVEVERNAIAPYLAAGSSYILIANGDGITSVKDPALASASVTKLVSGIGGQSRGVASDEGNKLVYLANGEGGMFVLEGPDGATPGDVMGAYNRNLTIDAKDVFTDGNNDFLFISDANGKLYIIEKQ